MLTTRSLYNGDLDFYRHPERGLSINLDSNPSLSERCTSSQSSRRQSPAIDHDSKAVGSQRKRVPVACDRCRKRKIKCSGDEGGGQGCVNCRNAGWDACQFLRVQSFNASVSTAAVVNGRSWSSNTRYHPYSYQSARPSSQGRTQSTYHPGLAPYSTWTNNIGYGDYSTPHQPSAWTRPPYIPQYSLPYDNEANDPYSVSAPPSYMLPDPELIHPLNISYASSFGRPQQHVMWLDQPNNVHMSQQNASGADGYAVNAVEGQPTFTPVTTSASCESPSERLFHSAAVSRCSLPAPPTVISTPPMSVASHRSSVGWQTDTASNSSVTSSQTSCSGQNETANSLSLATCEQQNLPYIYDQVSSMALTTVPASNLPMTTSEQSSAHSQQFADNALTGALRYQDTHRGCNRSPTPSALSKYKYGSVDLRGRQSNIGINERYMIDGGYRMWSISNNKTKEAAGEASRCRKFEGHPQSQNDSGVQLDIHQQY